MTLAPKVEHTVGKNVIGITKIQNNYVLYNYIHNIGLFTLLPIYVHIALPTLRYQKLSLFTKICLKFCIGFIDWVMTSFLYCFPYSCRSFTLLKALAKINGNLFAVASKSEEERQLSRKSITLERAIKKRSNRNIWKNK